MAGTSSASAPNTDEPSAAVDVDAIRKAYEWTSKHKYMQGVWYEHAGNLLTALAEAERRAARVEDSLRNVMTAYNRCIEERSYLADALDSTDTSGG